MHSRNPNIETAEIRKFDRLADDWWNPQGSLKTLHVINPVRLRYITHALSLNGKSVLDAGCGGGLLSEAMALQGAEVTGIDMNESAINIARQHSQQLSIEYFISTVEDFSLVNNKKFDVITCMELLEHVPDPESLLTSASKLLVPGGHLFLATINRNALSYLTSVLAAEYILKLLPKGTHDYAKFIRPAELCTWLRKTGFTVRDIAGMGYLPGIDTAFLTDLTSVNYLVYATLSDL